jgi:hypothetical protein
LNHSDPGPWDKQGRFGFFEKHEPKFHYTGESQPFADLGEEGGTVGEISFSLDGNWAAYLPTKNHRKTEGNFLYLVDGKSKKQYRLIEGWAYDFKWVPGFVWPR